jgi:hypothetical protein
MRLPPTGSDGALRSPRRHIGGESLPLDLSPAPSSPRDGRSVLPRHTGHPQQRVLINKSTCARSRRNIKDTLRGAGAARFRAASRSTQSTNAFRH